MRYLFGDYILDTQRAELHSAGEPTKLRRKAFQVLAYLLVHRDRVVPKQELLERLWPDQFVGDEVLKACIKAVRQTLGEQGRTPRYLRTLHGQGYRFVAPVEVREPLPADVTAPLSVSPQSAGRSTVPLVGREQELTRLHGWLTQARRGVRQMVFVTGEAGLGKTTLVEAFVGELGTYDPLWIGHGQCVAHYGVGEPYLPVLEALGRLCQGPGGQELVPLLGQQAPTWLVQMPGLVRAADLETLQRRSGEATRERMLRELVEALDLLTVRQPLVLVLEDLHWSDPSTLDLLGGLARRREPARLLLIATYRPPEVQRRAHPLHTIQQELQLHGHSVELPLTLLTEEAVATYLACRLPGLPWVDQLARLVHQRIGARLEAGHGAQVGDMAAELAMHFARGRDAHRAVQYLQQAGQHSLERSAYAEAAGHFTRALEVLKTLPAAPERTQQELTLHIALGEALQTIKGNAAPEVKHAYTQAHALCQQVGETPQLVTALFGLWRYYVTRSQLHTGQELGETLLRLAQHARDPALSVIAHHALGFTQLCLGALPAARLHLEEGLALYTPDQRRAPVFRVGQDPGVACRIYAARLLWLLGYSDQALAHIREALALAHKLSHPYSLVWAWCMAAFASQLRHDVLAVHAQAESAVRLSTEHGFPFWAAVGTRLRGWALAMQGQGEMGMAQVSQGMASVGAAGAVLHVPCDCTLLAEVFAHLGHTADGLQALAEAHTIMEQHEERWWEAEVYRLWGVLLLRQTIPQQVEAEVCFQQALDVARRQEAKSLELRAAMSLARLWQQQGKCAEARELLAPIYGWFTEGFDTADLQEAKALLEGLACL